MMLSKIVKDKIRHSDRKIQKEVGLKREISSSLRAQKLFSKVVTRPFLHKIRKVEDNLCSYCKREPKSILHLLLNAIKSKNAGNLNIFG